MRHDGSIQRSAKVGLPPGSLVYVGRKKEALTPTRITVIEYDAEYFREREVGSPRELFPLKPAPVVTWINVDGVSNPEILKSFGEAFNLHSLLLEDILNTDQRPKCEFTERNIYTILKMFEFEPNRHRILAEQVSLVLGENYLISFLEEVGGEFEPVRERIRSDHSRFRKSGPGYLAYSLLDTVVDRYFLTLEAIGESLDSLEDSLGRMATANALQRIHEIKRELIFLRKYIWPVREVVTALQHADSPLLPDSIQPYLRDVYEHTVQVMDGLETYRDLLSGIQDLYLSMTSNRLNDIMRVLTVISTIFIPLTFIAGVYGMNFHYMPELGWKWAYPAVWLVMILVAMGMIAFFRRKKWF
jgi:magnesium transporter